MQGDSGVRWRGGRVVLELFLDTSFVQLLLTDLTRTGLLDSTLVVWCGEFGRSPDNGVRMGTAFGRDHNPKGMTVWLAGGGLTYFHGGRFKQLSQFGGQVIKELLA
jgi:hypothetical protein